MSTEDRLPPWANLHRNLAAEAAVADVEAYAAGERRITVVTGDLESAADAERLRALHAQIETAVAATDYTGHERILGRNDRTTWCWRPRRPLDGGAWDRAFVWKESVGRGLDTCAVPARRGWLFPGFILGGC